MLPLASLSKFPFVPIGVLNSFIIIRSKLFEHVFDVLALTHKCAILHLLDLKTKEVTKLSNHGHLKLTYQHVCSLTLAWVGYGIEGVVMLE